MDHLFKMFGVNRTSKLINWFIDIIYNRLSSLALCKVMFHTEYRVGFIFVFCFFVLFYFKCVLLRSATEIAIVTHILCWDGLLKSIDCRAWRPIGERQADISPLMFFSEDVLES